MLPIAVIGPTEIFIIVGIGVLLFGIKKLPELGKGLAEGIHEFKKASKELQKDGTEETPATKSAEQKD